MTTNNNVVVDISSLTNRVDVLQQSVIALQAGLTQIRDTIPVNLPEFTQPVPVNITGSNIVDLTGIAAQLTEIKQVLETQLTPPPAPSPTSMLQPISLTSATVSINNWTQVNPTNLNAIVDGNPDSATTWGEVSGNNNRGWFQVDTGSADRRYFEVKLGARMNSGWDGGEGTWFIEASDDGVFFYPVLSNRARPTATEKVITLSFLAANRYLRIGCQDVGAGQVHLRVYELKGWKLTI
ncbi:MAG TPA: hypothetical protein DCE56_06600 [Cyanobacteria bacterium UBA8553]|nr:hypothetical protein [Cyanobacteria bacterium UBA8553]HAJ59294.1 hypothetical protein [Cyanobacteria bacterium UBA8543]